MGTHIEAELNDLWEKLLTMASQAKVAFEQRSEVFDLMR
jgi:hypothetical protein